MSVTDYMTVDEKISQGHYENNDPYPVKPRKPLEKTGSDLAGMSDDEVKEYLEYHRNYPDLLAQHRQKVMEYSKKTRELEMQFKEDLEKEYGLSDHPKKDDLYRIAFDYGHSHGLHEVSCHYDTLSELLT